MSLVFGILVVLGVILIIFRIIRLIKIFLSKEFWFGVSLHILIGGTAASYLSFIGQTKGFESDYFIFLCIFLFGSWICLLKTSRSFRTPYKFAFGVLTLGLVIFGIASDDSDVAYAHDIDTDIDFDPDNPFDENLTFSDEALIAGTASTMAFQTFDSMELGSTMSSQVMQQVPMFNTEFVSATWQSPVPSMDNMVGTSFPTDMDNDSFSYANSLPSNFETNGVTLFNQHDVIIDHDMDNDGFSDKFDFDWDNDGNPNQFDMDEDNDGTLNQFDRDEDNDLILDQFDRDEDNDGHLDQFDKDLDNDGTIDGVNNINTFSHYK